MILDTNLVTLQEQFTISDSLFIIRLSPKIYPFTAGQHISISLAGDTIKRVYSIASGENDNYYDLLIREIEDGKLTPKIKSLTVGTVLKVTKPTGTFMLPHNYKEYSIFCIATGSGIAPFLSFSKSFPDLSFTILHGIKTSADSFANSLPNNVTYISCASRKNEADYLGRVTDYVTHATFPEKSLFFLCGNSEMIEQINNYLLGVGVDGNAIFFEEYYKK